MLRKLLHLTTHVLQPGSTELAALLGNGALPYSATAFSFEEANSWGRGGIINTPVPQAGKWRLFCTLERLGRRVVPDADCLRLRRTSVAPLTPPQATMSRVIHCQSCCPGMLPEKLAAVPAAVVISSEARTRGAATRPGDAAF